MPAVRDILGRVADAVWPRTCPMRDCDRVSDRPGRHICSTCFAGLPFLEGASVCDVCGAPIAATVSHAFLCEDCRRSRPAFDRARGALRYTEAVGALIQDFKYRKAIHLAEDFADFLEATVRSLFESAAVDAIVPVPLHPHRLRERGYNQSALVAEILARRLGRRLDTTSLVRRRDTPKQAQNDADERRRNMTSAFAVAAPAYVRGRTLLVVDDVLTSGTTLSTCAKTLHEAGARAVWAVTIARAVKGDVR